MDTKLSVNTTLAGPFAGRFLPGLPYHHHQHHLHNNHIRLGDNSPPIGTHSPPVSLTPTSHHLPVTPHVLRPQPQLPPQLTTNGGSPTTTHLPNVPHPLSPLRIRVNSPNRMNAELIAATQTTHTISGGGIVRIMPQNGSTILHRPFSPSPQPKDIVSW